jgi:antibiotic biosynthesis monooxygenase (ABM) superfamily enzyme
MADTKPYLWMVWTRCAPELDAEFNKWYDEVHIPMLTRDGHIISVRRLRLSSEIESEQAPYLAVYEFKDLATFKDWLKSDALADARKEMRQTWGGRDMEIKSRACYEPVSNWG